MCHGIVTNIVFLKENFWKIHVLKLFMDRMSLNSDKCPFLYKNFRKLHVLKFTKHHLIFFGFLVTRSCALFPTEGVHWKKCVFVSEPHKFVQILILSRWHCIKSVHIRSYPGPHFPAFGPEYKWIRTVFTQCEICTLR